MTMKTPSYVLVVLLTVAVGVSCSERRPKSSLRLLGIVETKVPPTHAADLKSSSDAFHSIQYLNLAIPEGTDVAEFESISGVVIDLGSDRHYFLEPGDVFTNLGQTLVVEELNVEQQTATLLDISSQQRLTVGCPSDEELARHRERYLPNQELEPTG